MIWAPEKQDMGERLRDLAAQPSLMTDLEAEASGRGDCSATYVLPDLEGSDISLPPWAAWEGEAASSSDKTSSSCAVRQL